MTEKDALALIEMLYPYFIKKYKEDNSFKQTAQITNGTVYEDNSLADTKSKVKIKINPYDSDYIEVTKGIGDELKIGDVVEILYYDSLKNARIIAKY